jgi:uncharacterized lipoprotein YmbA
MKSSLLALAVLTMLGACTVFPDTPPARLYSLDLPSFKPTQSCPVSFALRDVKIPGFLDRAEVVLSQTGYSIRTSPQHLWASPPTKDFTKLTARGMQELLGSSIAQPYPIRQFEKPDWVLSAEITRLTIAKDNYAMEMTLNGYRLPTGLETTPGAAKNQANMATQSRLVPIVVSSQVAAPQDTGTTPEAEQVARALSELLGQNLSKLSVDLAKTVCR